MTRWAWSTTVAYTGTTPAFRPPESPPSEGRLSPLSRFFVMVLAGDLAVVGILLAVLPSPVPALIAFVVLGLSSLFFVRTLPKPAR